MITIPTRTRVNHDGELDLRLKTALPEGDVDVIVVLQPVENGSDARQRLARLAGSISESTFERPRQGRFEDRESLD